MCWDRPAIVRPLHRGVIQLQMAYPDRLNSSLVKHSFPRHGKFPPMYCLGEHWYSRQVQYYARVSFSSLAI